MARYELPRPRSRKRALRITLFVVILLLLLGARTVASTVIDYQWWKELGQVDTWLNLYLYASRPALGRYRHCVRCALDRTCARPEIRRNAASASTRLTAGFRRSRCCSSASWSPRRRSIPGRSFATSAAATLPEAATAGTTRSSASRLPSIYFDLPFYSDLRQYVCSRDRGLLSWCTGSRRASGNCAIALRSCARCARSIRAFFGWRAASNRSSCAAPLIVGLLALAFRFFLGRYEMVLNQHTFLVGVDYVDNYHRSAAAVADDRRRVCWPRPSCGRAAGCSPPRWRSRW